MVDPVSLSNSLTFLYLWSSLDWRLQLGEIQKSWSRWKRSWKNTWLIFDSRWTYQFLHLCLWSLLQERSSNCKKLQASKQILKQSNLWKKSNLEESFVTVYNSHNPNKIYLPILRSLHYSNWKEHKNKGKQTNLMKRWH